MTLRSRRGQLLLDLARAIYDTYDCITECNEGEPGGSTLCYRHGRPCEDCDCFKCMAARALRYRPKRKRTPPGGNEGSDKET